MKTDVKQMTEAELKDERDRIKHELEFIHFYGTEDSETVNRFGNKLDEVNKEIENRKPRAKAKDCPTLNNFDAKEHSTETLIELKKCLLECLSDPFRPPYSRSVKDSLKLQQGYFDYIEAELDHRGHKKQVHDPYSEGADHLEKLVKNIQNPHQVEKEKTMPSDNINKLHEAFVAGLSEANDKRANMLQDFACHAMPGVMHQFPVNLHKPFGDWAKQVADKSYIVACAMLDEHERVTGSLFKNEKP